MKQNPALHTRKCRHTALGIGSDLKRVIPGAGLVLLACVLACGEEAAPETSSKPPDEAARFFGLDRLWTMHLILEAAHWTAMEPVRPEGSMGPRGPGRMERDYPEVPGELEWEGHRWTGVSVRYKGNSSFNFAGDSLKRKPAESGALPFARRRGGSGPREAELRQEPPVGPQVLSRRGL